MEIKVMMVSFFGTITKIGNIKTTEGGHKVVSVTIPSKVGIQDTLEMKPIEVSFWDKDADVLSQFPVGTPIFIREGALYIKPFINKENGKADVSIVVSDYQWSIVGETESKSAPTSSTKKSTPPSSAPIPAILNEVMNAGKKYKGMGMTYYQILSNDREYIDSLILSDQTPENWKVRLVEVTKIYDDYTKNQHG